MEVLVAVIGCVGNCLSPHASSSWEHYKNIKRNWKELEAASIKLDILKKDIDEKLKVLVKPGVTKETNEVRHWLNSVEEISKEIDGIKQKVKEIKFYARAGCGEEVVVMRGKVKTIYEEGGFCGRALVQELPQQENIEKSLKELKDASGKLTARETDIRNRLKVIPGVTEETNEVRNWLERYEEITKEIGGIEDKVKKVKLDDLARCGKEVVEMIEKVEKLYQEGAFPDSALLRKLSQRGMELPTTTILEDEATSHKMRKKILACLLDEKVSKIGVFGMGGIGKTTALEHINNELLLNPKFDKVVFLTVSKDSTVKGLQDKIASRLMLDLSNNDDEEMRAVKLHGKLKESKRFVLILDDMWDSFALKDVGIPEPISENGCKLVLTTRSRDVCSRMSCEPIIQMETLSKDEALNLFCNSVGKRVSSNPKLEQMVKQVAQECACLPLAIVTVAGFLRDKDDPNYWVIALEDLKKATPSMSTDITEILRLSYDRLKDKKHKECLLYCALYPEDYPIEKDLLIDQLIAMGIVDEIITMHPMERGQVMLNHLVSVSLLIDTVERNDSKCVKLHDSIRDMALQIMRKNPTQFMAKAGESVESIPAGVIWNKDVEMVSLMRSKIVEISIEPPNCPILLTLFLSGNSDLKSIPRNFFQQMQGLSVLDLSSTEIVELPESVSFLLNLTVLLLIWCRNLEHVPDLSKLSNMRRLDLCGTSIEEVPKGMENMVKLTYLGLSWTKLASLPTGILCNLTNLQYLSLPPNLVVTEDLANQRNLKTLRCTFAELKHLNAYVRSLEEGSLTNFKLTTKEERERQITIDQFELHESTSIVKLKDCDTTVSSESADFPLSLPKNVEILEMKQCRINVRSLCELTSIDNITNLQQLRIGDCGDDLMYLLYYSQAIFPILQRIERLELIQLPSLRDFVGIEGEGVQPSLPAGSFSSLKYLWIGSCGNLKKLFSLKNASFPNLEEIAIGYCSELEEIVSTTTSRENEIEEGGAAHHTTTVDVVTLPKLRILFLWHLPKLQSIPFVADSLKNLTISKCPNLKRIPFLDREPWHPSLEEVGIDKKSWSSLEWNYLKDKDAYWRELNKKKRW